MHFDIFAEDNPRGNVPDSFPGSIGLVANDEGKVILNPAYRIDNGTENKEFHYFIQRILSAINPMKSRFVERKCKDLVSKIYSITDEAFGLLIIYNEHHLWMDQEEMKKQGDKGTKMRKRKRFCDCRSGNKQGWSLEGFALFNSLCHQIKTRREETIDMEEIIRNMFVAGCSKVDAVAGGPPCEQTSEFEKSEVFEEAGVGELMANTMAKIKN